MGAAGCAGVGTVAGAGGLGCAIATEDSSKVNGNSSKVRLRSVNIIQFPCKVIAIS